MATKQLPDSVYAPDGSLYITLTDGAGNLVPSSSGSGAVSSVFTRTGAVVAVSGDYSVGQVTGAAPTASPTFTGVLSVPAGSASTPSLAIGNISTGLYSVLTTGLGFSVNGTNILDYGITNSGVVTAASLDLVTGSMAALKFTNNAGGIQFRNGNMSLISPATSTLQLGAPDASVAFAQTLQVQSVVAGNGNTAGGTWILQGSLSNGSGGGDVVFNTTLSTASSGVQNVGATALTLKGGTQQVQLGTTLKFASYTVSTLPSASSAGAGAMSFVTDASTTLVLGLGGAVSGGGANKVPVYSDGTNWNYG